MHEMSDFDKAISLCQDSKWKESLALFKPLAEAGNAESQYWLAEIYNNGFHRLDDPLGSKAEAIQQMKADQEEAIRWYTLAAEQGHGWACNDLAFLYSERYIGEAEWPEIEAKAKDYITRAEQLATQEDIFLPVLYINSAAYFEAVKKRYFERMERRQRILHGTSSSIDN